MNTVRLSRLRVPLGNTAGMIIQGTEQSAFGGREKLASHGVTGVKGFFPS